MAAVVCPAIGCGFSIFSLYNGIRYLSKESPSQDDINLAIICFAGPVISLCLIFVFAIYGCCGCCATSNKVERGVPAKDTLESDQNV